MLPYFFYFVLILFKTFDRRFKREAFYIIYLANIFGNIKKKKKLLSNSIEFINNLSFENHLRVDVQGFYRVSQTELHDFPVFRPNFHQIPDIKI